MTKTRRKAGHEYKIPRHNRSPLSIALFSTLNVKTEYLTLTGVRLLPTRQSFYQPQRTDDSSSCKNLGVSFPSASTFHYELSFLLDSLYHRSCLKPRLFLSVFTGLNTLEGGSCYTPYFPLFSFYFPLFTFTIDTSADTLMDTLTLPVLDLRLGSFPLFPLMTRSESLDLIWTLRLLFHFEPYNAAQLRFLAQLYPSSI